MLCVSQHGRRNIGGNTFATQTHANSFHTCTHSLTHIHTIERTLACVDGHHVRLLSGHVIQHIMRLYNGEPQHHHTASIDLTDRPMKEKTVIFSSAHIYVCVTIMMLALPPVLSACQCLAMSILLVYLPLLLPKMSGTTRQTSPHNRTSPSRMHVYNKPHIHTTYV